MGRPPLAPGAHGHITFYKDQGSGRVRARARCRDYDGRYLAVTRWGGDQTEAGARLLGALDGHTAFPLGPHHQVRALTTGEAADLQTRLRGDPQACRLDLPDLVQFMLGTGVRIGGAAAVRHAVLDLQAGTVHINATVIRIPGAGLQIQQRTKTPSSQRVLTLPEPVLDTLTRRERTAVRAGPAGTVFPSPTGRLRDPSNTQADLRGALDRAGYPWVTSHTFRKTVASHLDDAGFPIRHIADQLGHAALPPPSTTTWADGQS